MPSRQHRGHLHRPAPEGRLTTGVACNRKNLGIDRLKQPANVVSQMAASARKWGFWPNPIAKFRRNNESLFGSFCEIRGTTLLPTLAGENVKLRLPCAEDIEARFHLGNNADIAEMFGASRSALRPITRESASRWVQKLVDHPHAWVIEIQGKFAGEIRLENIDYHDRRATMAIGIFNPALLGKGYGSEAIALLLQYAFVTLGLHRIGIRVLAYNGRAIRAYEKCGFVIEGREREAAFVNGAWHDDVMMGLLDREFVSPKS